MTILSGALGQKKTHHIHVGKVLDTEIDAIKAIMTVLTNR
jgi:hypothetical protein